MTWLNNHFNRAEPLAFFWQISIGCECFGAKALFASSSVLLLQFHLWRWQSQASLLLQQFLSAKVKYPSNTALKPAAVLWMAFRADVQLAAAARSSVALGFLSCRRISHSLVLQINSVAGGQLLPSPLFAPYLKNSLFVCLFHFSFISLVPHKVNNVLECIAINHISLQCRNHNVEVLSANLIPMLPFKVALWM